MLLCDGLTYVDDDGKHYSLGTLDALCGNTTYDVVVIFDNMESRSKTRIAGWFFGASEFNNPSDREQMDRLNECCHNVLHPTVEQEENKKRNSRRIN